MVFTRTGKETAPQIWPTEKQALETIATKVKVKVEAEAEAEANTETETTGMRKAKILASQRLANMKKSKSTKEDKAAGKKKRMSKSQSKSKSKCKKSTRATRGPSRSKNTKTSKKREKEKHSLLLKHSILPKTNDVVFGLHGGALQGLNLFYRQVIREHLKGYYSFAPSKGYGSQKKLELIKSKIIPKILDHGGKFFYIPPEKKTWQLLVTTDEEHCTLICKKISQALRDEKKQCEKKIGKIETERLLSQNKESKKKGVEMVQDRERKPVTENGSAGSSSIKIVPRKKSKTVKKKWGKKKLKSQKSVVGHVSASKTNKNFHKESDKAHTRSKNLFTSTGTDNKSHAMVAAELSPHSSKTINAQVVAKESIASFPIPKSEILMPEFSLERSASLAASAMMLSIQEHQFEESKKDKDIDDTPLDSPLPFDSEELQAALLAADIALDDSGVQNLDKIDTSTFSELPLLVQELPPDDDDDNEECYWHTNNNKESEGTELVFHDDFHGNLMHAGLEEFPVTEDFEFSVDCTMTEVKKEFVDNIVVQ